MDQNQIIVLVVIAMHAGVSIVNVSNATNIFDKFFHFGFLVLDSFHIFCTFSFDCPLFEPNQVQLKPYLNGSCFCYLVFFIFRIAIYDQLM